MQRAPASGANTGRAGGRPQVNMVRGALRGLKPQARSQVLATHTPVAGRTEP